MVPRAIPPHLNGLRDETHMRRVVDVMAGALAPPALLATTEYDCRPVTLPRRRHTSVSVGQLVQL